MSSEGKAAPVDSNLILSAFTDFATDVETACIEFKRKVGASRGAVASEEPFLALTGWTKSQGGKIGEYEYTTRQANSNSDSFNHCMNILKTNNANIRNHFGEKNWHYYYWLWPEGQPDSIYRKQRSAVAT